MPDRQRQIMVRRAVGLGVVVLLLILIVLGIRGCLNARKQRSFENYASDLNAIVAQTKQLSDNFFGKLNNPGNLSPLSFRAEIDTDRGTAETLDSRVHSLDTPGELKDAQNDLNLSYDLRRDGMAGIADQIPTALGKAGSSNASTAIAGFMKYFLASDVLYSRAEAEINSELSNQGIDQRVPDSVFLPEPIADWLDPLKISGKLAAISGGKQVTSGVHGLGLLQTSVGGTALSTSTPSTVSGSPSAVDVEVQNQGDSTETNIAVSVQLTGGTQTVSGDGTIPRIIAGGNGTAKVPLEPAPATGQQLTLEVTVQPVPGEQVSTNNRATYQVTFG
ncbi:MAG TPA: CARDB domain-containing protein [Solirubrobacterales bacterium]|nr:CARDB domain-containing protein [Solirubrobacterales bacterium]